MCSIPSSTSVVTGNMNSMMLVWDTTRSCEHWDVIAECEGHRRSIWTLAYIRDTARLASGSADHTIRIWNTASWECELTLEDHTGWVVGLSCGPGSLLSCSIDQGVKLWDCKTWECERTFSDQEYEVYCVCTFSGGRLATGGAEMAILIYGGPEHDKPHHGHGGTAFPGLARSGTEAPPCGPPASMPRSTSPRGQDSSKPRAPSTWGGTPAPATWGGTPTTSAPAPQPSSSGYDWMSLPEWVTAPIASMTGNLTPRSAAASSHATPPMPTGQEIFPEPEQCHREHEPQASAPQPQLKERRRELQAATAELDFTMSDFRKHIVEVEAEAAKKKNKNPRSNSPKESRRIESPVLSSPPQTGGYSAAVGDSPKFGQPSKARVAPEDDMLFDTWHAVPNDKDLGLRPTASNAEGVTEWSSALLSRK